MSQTSNIDPGQCSLPFSPESFVFSSAVKRKTIPVTGGRGLQGCEMSRTPHFLDNRLREGGEVVRLTRRPRFTPQKHFLVLISVRSQANSRTIVRLKALDKLKNSITSQGIEQAIFRFVA
jgi:hypothetical protein